MIFFRHSQDTDKLNMNRLFMGTLIPLLTITFLAGGTLAFISLKILKKYVQSETSSVITSLNKQIMEYISPVITNIDNFSNFATESSDKDTLERLVYVFAEDLPYVISFYYATEDFHTGSGTGFYVGSDAWSPPEDWVPKNRDWFQSATKKNGATAFQDVYIDAMSGDPCVTIAKGIKDHNNNIKGVVAIDLLMSNLALMINSFSVSKRCSIYLLSQDGYFMTHKDTDKIMKANYFEDSSIPYTAAQYLDGEQKAFVYKDTYYAVTRIDETPWFIVAEGPIKDFSEGFTLSITILEILLIAFSILCSIVNIRSVNRMHEGEMTLGKKILTETMRLASSAKENAATSQDQSTAVKEIVATMEENTALSENISIRIKDVASIAGKSNSYVNDGVKYLDENIERLKEIALTNQATIDGIKELGERIENISDIVTLITSVADQAKIIAFNAELEASTAGETGKNFHIVASEIRRLSDGIIESTKDIKDRIDEIQQSSDTLIIASESGTEKINSGMKNASNLKIRFDSIKNASEITADSASNITTIIQQQAVASEQILITLKQIAAGAEHFYSATENISSASQNLRTIAEELNK